MVSAEDASLLLCMLLLPAVLYFPYKIIRELGSTVAENALLNIEQRSSSYLV